MAKKSLPTFTNEAEEVAFYEAHQDDLLDYFEPVTTTDPGLGYDPTTIRVTKPITMRISSRDLDRAKAIAARKGIGYQTLLKMAIHEWLDREERSAM
jgi:predicted DNA binding CopG/RHH family protein